jgi:hypothetical protein
MEVNKPSAKSGLAICPAQGRFARGLGSFDLYLQTQESFMTGFIRGLFGSKVKNPGEADRPVRQPAAPQEPTIKQVGGAYFLDADDAKSFGNIEYMRSAKTVRRTFAKKRGETEEKESIRQISAMEAKRLQEKGVAIEKLSPSEVVIQPAARSEANFSRRKVDTNLDMFRKMAKDLKK